MSRGRYIGVLVVVLAFAGYAFAQGPIERLSGIFTDRGVERVINDDSVGVLNLHATLTDTTTTWGKANVDHAADVVMDLFYVGGGAGLYEEVIFTITAEILNFDSLGASRLDSATHKDSCENLLLFGLTCCSTAACSAFFNDSSEDSASYFDSTQGYVIVEQSLIGDQDSAYGNWSYPDVPSTSVDSFAFTDVVTASELTIKPTMPYLRVRTQVHADTDAEDTVGIVVTAKRKFPYFGPFGPVELQPDYFGAVTIRDTTAAGGGSIVLDTILTWPSDNTDHKAGEVIRLTYPGYGGGTYTTLTLEGRPLTTTSADRCTCAGYVVLDQSVDRVTWAPVDSAELKGATVTSFTKAITLTGKPFGRLRGQVIDSTDHSTGCDIEVTGYREK